MGGKSSTSTSQVSVPPQVLAQYQAVNALADQTAQTPFQTYSTNPNAFVAPLNSTETGAISSITGAANEAAPYYAAAQSALGAGNAASQPYYNSSAYDLGQAGNIGSSLGQESLSSLGQAGAASQPYLNAAGSNYGTAYTGAQPYNAASGSGLVSAYSGAQPYQSAATNYALAGSQAVNPTTLDSSAINKYLSPYLGDVAQSEEGLLNQQNQQAISGELGNAISSGAFGGDRAGIAAANVNQQNQLAAANIYSNILNTGYNTALNTAEGQQSLGLSAGQANRSALQNASGQLQGIGQQGYAQGTGTAQALGSLGNQLYTQGMGLGSAQQGLGGQLYSQGANTAAQQAALSNELYGQGLSSAQQEQSLGQTQFGQGATTANTEAALGSGAESAALQGAEAQLGAGQVAQQTSQAGLSALYNQFEQQQAYPFQVDQFLANIAEGTGSLSGSTTTTTTPGGLFSDERLKEDIEPVGKTYDGQTIYKFRYKGKPETHIGFLAQKVEKSHPGAVGQALGFKTVNYDEATKDAAKKGHFARGGFAEGGMTGDQMAALLQAQNAMYAPFTQSGLYGKSASGLPHGGSSYVPSANVPVGHLQTAQPIRSSQQSPLQSASQVAQLADSSTVQKGASALGSMFGPHVQSPIDPITAGNPDVTAQSMPDLSDFSSAMPQMALGGAAANNNHPYRSQLKRALGGRMHYDIGGETDEIDDMPYANQGDLNIPNQHPDTKLATANSPGGSGSNNTIGQIGQLAGGVGSAATGLSKLLPMLLALKTGGRVGYDALKNGGRPHYDDGGLLPAKLLPKDMADSDLQSTLSSLFNPPPPVQDMDDSAPPAVAVTGGGLAPAGLPPSPAKPAGLGLAPTDLSGMMSEIAKAEGTGKNPLSSARGMYQIIDPTFVGLFKQMFPDQAKGMSNAQIIAIRSTPQGDQLSAQMGPVLAKQNIDRLQSVGIQPTAPNVYLAHLLGPTGAIKTITADPTTPISSIVSPEAVAANRSIMQGKTAGDLVQWAANRLQRFSRATGGRAGFDDGGFAGSWGLDSSDPNTSPSDPSAAPPPDSPVFADSTSAPPPDSPPPPPTGLGARPQPASDAELAPPSGPHQSVLSSIGNDISSLGSQAMNELKKPEVFIPLLSGIAAMGAAQTKYPLIALTQGLGAGATAAQAQRAFGLQQQQTAQHGLEVGVEQAMVPIRQYEAQTGRLTAQQQALAQARAIFDSNYSPMPGATGPDNFPMWKNNITGQAISQTEYSQERGRFLSQTLGGMGSLSGPLGAVPGLLNGTSNGGGSAIPSPSGAPSAPGGVPGNAPGVGSGSAPVPGRPNNAGASSVAPAALASGLGPPKSIADFNQRVKSGYYRSPPTPLPPVDNTQIADSDNPAILQQRGNQLITMGDAQSIAIGQNLINRAHQITSGEVIPIGKDGNPYNGYALQAQARAAQNAVTQKNAADKAQTNTEMAATADQYAGTKQIVDSLINVSGETNMNRLAPELSNMAGELLSTGVVGPNSPYYNQLLQYESNVDIAQKDAARQTITAAAMSGLGSRAPASLLRLTGMSIPDATKSPDARWELLAQTRAQLGRNYQMAQDWNAQKDQVDDPNRWTSEWNIIHPIEGAQNWAYRTTPYFDGMTPQQKAAHPRILQQKNGQWDMGQVNSGDPFVVPDGPQRGQIRWVP